MGKLVSNSFKRPLPLSTSMELPKARLERSPAGGPHGLEARGWLDGGGDRGGEKEVLRREVGGGESVRSTSGDVSWYGAKSMVGCGPVGVRWRRRCDEFVWGEVEGRGGEVR